MIDYLPLTRYGSILNRIEIKASKSRLSGISGLDYLDWNTGLEHWNVLK